MKVSKWQAGLIFAGVFLMGYSAGVLGFYAWLEEFVRAHHAILIALLGGICIVVAVAFAVKEKARRARMDLPDPPWFKNHEIRSKLFFDRAQGRLNAYAAVGNLVGIQGLAVQLDAQLKLEDFLVKFREADHAKIKVWGTIFAAGVISLITTLLALALRR